MNSEFTNLHPRKADEKKNPIKLKSSDLELESERYPIFKISHFSGKILGKIKNTKN